MILFKKNNLGNFYLASKRAQVADSIAWFFAIIVIIVILILFYLGTVFLSNTKKVDSVNLGIDEKNFEKLNSLWALESFLFFKQNNMQEEVIYTFFKLRGSSLASLGTSPIVNLDLEKNKALMITYFTEYIKMYEENSLSCYMLVIDNYYTGKNCINYKLNSDYFFQFDKKELAGQFFDLKINGQTIGLKITGVKNE